MLFSLSVNFGEILIRFVIISLYYKRSVCSKRSAGGFNVPMFFRLRSELSGK